MRQFLVPGLLWLFHHRLRLLAGVHSAFSAFFMTVLGRIDQGAGIATLNSANAVIVRLLLVPVFLGSSTTALTVLAFSRWGQPGAGVMFAGGLVYVVGMFVVTMVFNLPLNDALAAVVRDSAQTADF